MSPWRFKAGTASRMRPARQAQA